MTSVPTSIARALIDGLTQDVIADDAAIRRLVPQRLLTFREAAEHEHRVVARWVEGAMACRNYIAVTAYFHPAGIWGLLYWYPLVSFHRYLFRGTVRAIARGAEAEAGRVPVASGQPPTA